MPKPDTRPGSGWYSKAELCAFQDISEQVFDRSYRPLVPPAAIQKTGDGRVWYRGGLYLDAIIAHRVQQATAKLDATGPADPMLAGPETSEWLEEYRKHRARVAKIEADEREALSLSVPQLKAGLSAVFVSFRQTGEHIERQFGPGAGQVFREGVEDAKRACERAVGEIDEQGNAIPSGDAGPSAAPPPSPDEGVCGTGDSDTERPV